MFPITALKQTGRVTLWIKTPIGYFFSKHILTNTSLFSIQTVGNIEKNRNGSRQKTANKRSHINFHTSLQSLNLTI